MIKPCTLREISKKERVKVTFHFLRIETRARRDLLGEKEAGGWQCQNPTSLGIFPSFYIYFMSCIDDLIKFLPPIPLPSSSSIVHFSQIRGWCENLAPVWSPSWHSCRFSPSAPAILMTCECDEEKVRGGLGKVTNLIKTQISTLLNWKGKGKKESSIWIRPPRYK